MGEDSHLYISSYARTQVIHPINKYQRNKPNTHFHLFSPADTFLCVSRSDLEFKICPFSCFRKKTFKNMTITLEDLRGDSPAICGHFNKIKEEVIRAAGENQNEVEKLLTQRILMEFVQFHMKKRKQYLEKKPLEKKKTKPLDRIPYETDVYNRKPKRQRKNPTEIKQAIPDQPPCMLKDKIMGLQGSEIKLVIQKELTITDMKGSQDRLSIPRGQMRYDFLSREEQVSLEKKEANGIHFKGMEFPLIEPGLKVSSISLKKWKLGNSSSYMLSNPWMDVAKRNELKSGDNVQLWSFRVNQSPHLALIKLDN